MATAVTLLSTPHSFPSPMASKRVPLANNPNAANSPSRAAGPASKRSRAQTNELQDQDPAQSPPKKKQLLDISGNGARRVHNIPLDDREAKVFAARAEHTPPNAFQKKLVAAVREGKQRDQKPAPSDNKGEREKAAQADIETIRQWRRHYRKVFPSFVFFLEGLPQDVCIRCSRHLTVLGAREEKFFSKAVTHVVTARSLPPPTPDTDSGGSHPSSSRTGASQANVSSSRTINPSLLDKHAEQLAKINSQPPRNRNVSDSLSQRRPPQTTWPQQTNTTDVLHKAREMGIKIWPLEKFERMMRTIFDPEGPDQDDRSISRKSVAPLRAGPQHQDDLSKLLHNEKAAERPPWDSITAFRGYYIYVHDLDEKTKPVMVRDYPKVTNKEDGEWPQFRSVPAPKCPFVELSDEKKEDRSKEEKRAPAESRNIEQQPRTRAVSAALEAGQAAVKICEKQEAPTKPAALREADNNARSMPKPALPGPPTAKTFEPPQLKHTDSLPPQLSNRFQLPAMPRAGHCREPMASGLQQSNQTSAIRSQMISSTAANPSARAGTSKEMHQLQRRVVEHRHRSTLSVTSVPSSYMNDIRAAINNDQPPVERKTTRRKPTQPLAKIHEDETQSEDEEKHQSMAQVTKAPKKKSAVRKKPREPKPGYCENCRDKYDDFNEHVESKKHRKFALTAENWLELDDLLSHLVRK